MANEFEYYEKLFKKYELDSYKNITKHILSLPIPMSYEVWDSLHKYLDKVEQLEKELME